MVWNTYYEIKRCLLSFQEALPILEKIKAAGFEAILWEDPMSEMLSWIRPIHDVDIASSSYPEETRAIFDRTVDIDLSNTGQILVLEWSRI